MRIEFLRDHDHYPQPAVCQAFTKGTVDNLPEATAKALIDQGVAKAAAKASPETAQPKE